MNNPQEILKVLDRRLDHRVEITLYGRSALALGYPNHWPIHEATRDVDSIISVEQLAALREDEGFWDAKEATNQELEAHGLYMVHLFTELDVVIQPDWMQRRINIPAQFQHLTLFRPGTIDLILTKMMRDDRQDLEDIRFLLSQELFTIEQLKAAFVRSRVPEVEEIRAIFLAVQPRVLALLGKG